MSAPFRPLSLSVPVALSAIVLLASVGHAQTPAPTGAAPAPAGVTPAPSSSAGMTTPTEAAKKMIVSAIQKMNANNVDGALSDLTQAIQANPSSTGAYVLRASIYCQRHQWQPATDDFLAAQKIAPSNVVVKFNLVEIKFMQKQYDAARPGFLALANDPDMGDFAQYKVFLCDLFGGHEAQARKELDVFNAAMGNPSYYFANAAWDLVHKDIEGARSWLVSATHIYPVNKFTTYGQSLRDLGYLPIPEPGQTTVAPAGTAAP
jgi:tetratricopeptide (TPR) repeat protein